jgi:hypothetical protein
MFSLVLTCNTVDIVASYRLPRYPTAVISPSETRNHGDRLKSTRPSPNLIAPATIIVPLRATAPPAATCSVVRNWPTPPIAVR